MQIGFLLWNCNSGVCRLQHAADPLAQPAPCRNIVMPDSCARANRAVGSSKIHGGLVQSSEFATASFSSHAPAGHPRRSSRITGRGSSRPEATRWQEPLEAPAAPAGKGQGPDSLLTVNQVAELLQVDPSWVYGRTRSRCANRLPGFRLGKYWRYRRSEVLAWIEEQRAE